MGFIPPLNLGNFQPSPATLSQWIYQIWQYLQENPIATQEQLQEYIATFITTSPETQELIGEGVEQYLTDNPPQAPVQSVQGKTGAVTLAFNDILKNNNTAPVYRASSMPSQSTLQAQYNLGYRLFVNTSTQEIYSITNTGVTTLVGKGKFDGTDIDLDTSQGDTTISEAVTAIEASIGTLNTNIGALQTDFNNFVSTGTWTPTFSRVNVASIISANYLKIGKLVIAKAIVDFGTSTNQGNIYLENTSIPFEISVRPIGVFGIGRATGNDSNIELSTGDTNNNVWISRGSAAVTGDTVSNKRFVFELIYFVS